MRVICWQIDVCAACISSITQHCSEGERGMLIKQSKKYCKCSKTFGRDCYLNKISSEDLKSIIVRLSLERLSL